MKSRYGACGTDDSLAVIHCKFTYIKNIEIMEYLNFNSIVIDFVHNLSNTICCALFPVT
jgi:hypothetical protein